MSGRQPKDTDLKTRVHIHVIKKNLAVIDRAAKKLGFARSNYMARVAYEHAKVELEKGKKDQ